MSEWINLFLTDYTFRIVTIGTATLGLLCGVVGVLTTFSRKSLLGDALSHAALPGIVIGFLIIGHKEWLILLTGAAISGLIAVTLINFLSQHTPVKYDSALSLILSTFFGLGLILLTYASRFPNANQAGLENFIYGQASSMLKKDVQFVMIAAVFIIGLIILFWKELKTYIFDPIFARTVMDHMQIVSHLISFLTVLVIVLSLETVGVILTSALLITPVISARQWSNRLSTVMILAGIFGVISGAAGTLMSSSAQKVPTGPSIIVVISLILIVSLLFAPERGLIARAWRQRQFRRKLREQVSEEAKQ